MATLPDIEPFNGDSWEECSSFIRNIRAAAWKEGKVRDPAWMADLASIHFSLKALSWFSRLSPDIQEDWSKLQVALVEHWSPPEELAGSQVIPVAAAAPAVEQKDTMERILQVVFVGTASPFYVTMDSSEGYCKLTSEVRSALRFRFDAQSSLPLFECFDVQPKKWLAVHWAQTDPLIGKGSYNYSVLTAVGSELKSSYHNDGPFQLASGKVSSTDEVIFVWKNGNTETEMALFTNRTGIFPVSDPETYQAKYPNEEKISLFVRKPN